MATAVGMTYGSVTRPMTERELKTLWDQSRAELIAEYMACKETCFEAIQESPEPLRSALHNAALAGDELLVGRLAIQRMRDYCETLADAKVLERYQEKIIQYEHDDK